MKDTLSLAASTLLILVAAFPAWSLAEPLDTPVRFQIDVDRKPLGGTYEPFYTSRDYKRRYFGYWRKIYDEWRLTVWYMIDSRGKGTIQPRYPAPEPGEILPMFGRLYHATGRLPAYNLTFVRLTDDEIPMGYDVHREGTWIVPLLKGDIPPEGSRKYGWTFDSPNGYLDVGLKGKDLKCVRFTVTSIEADPKHPGTYLASAKAGMPGSGVRGKVIDLSLREGKTYDLGGHPLHKFTVRRIVPRDDKLKTMGWVELELAWRKDDR